MPIRESTTPTLSVTPARCRRVRCASASEASTGVATVACRHPARAVSSAGATSWERNSNRCPTVWTTTVMGNKARPMPSREDQMRPVKDSPPRRQTRV
ncbi:MAG: DUF1589 domain-containing protein [Opitutaceae bacterium]|nr:DUF1589 domain-containing protein [Opitutaceae bacterium]